MKFTGKLLSVNRDWRTGEYNIVFSVNEESALPEIEKIQNLEKLSIEAKQYRAKRSLDANALLWACLSEIAVALRTDKWDVYLTMLKRYGKYTYICVKPNIVDAVKAQWRECEEIGSIDINGQEAVQLLCYFGSSTYDTKEMSVLIDGVISEMKEMGLQTPESKEVRRIMEEYEKHHSV